MFLYDLLTFSILTALNVSLLSSIDQQLQDINLIIRDERVTVTPNQRTSRFSLSTVFKSQIPVLSTGQLERKLLCSYALGQPISADCPGICRGRGPTPLRAGN